MKAHGFKEAGVTETGKLLLAKAAGELKPDRNLALPGGRKSDNEFEKEPSDHTMTLPDLIEQDLNALSISDEVTHTVLAGIEGEFGRLGLGYEKAREYLRPFRGRKYLSLGTGNTSVVATADTLRGKIFVTPFFPGPTPDPNEIARRLDRFVDYLDHHYPRDKDVIIVLPDFYAASMSASNRLSPTGANNRWETLSFQAYQLIRDNF